jgi:hypothetical protein
MVVNAIWFSTKVKCCKGNTKTLHPSKKVYNLYTNICFQLLLYHRVLFDVKLFIFNEIRKYLQQFPLPCIGAFFSSLETRRPH